MIAILDVGGSSVKAGCVDMSGAPSGELTRTMLDHTAPADALIARFADAARSIHTTDRLALAIPDPFDYESGVSLMTHKFAALHGVDVVEALVAALAEPTIDIRCCNDAAAAVAGEAVAGAGQRFARVLGITLGTGLGAALVVDGLPVAEAAGIVVGDLYRRELPDGRSADEALSARTYDARRRADEPGVDASFGSDLAAFLGPIAAAVDADVVVVGGGGAASFEAFAPTLLAQIDVPVVRAALGDWAPVVGAASICFG